MARVTTPRGELHYDVSGDPAAPPLLLAMGLVGRGSDWTPEMLAPLRARRRCIVYDHLGIGLSGPFSSPPTLPSMAEDAIAILDDLGIERADVVGLSMGGMIAQRIGIDHPSRVRRLVPMGTHAGGPEVVRGDPEVLRLVMSPRAGLEAMTEVMAALCAPGFAKREPEKLAAFVRRKLDIPVRFSVLQAQTNAIMADARAAELSRISAPTMVVHGADDRLVDPANGRFLASRIPGARYRELADCGHLPHLEVPEELARVLLEFLEE